MRETRLYIVHFTSVLRSENLENNYNCYSMIVPGVANLVATTVERQSRVTELP